MGLFKVFYEIIHKDKKAQDKRTNFIFYKIVDSALDQLVLQCINTKTILYLKIEEIVFDVDILYGLHPIQACYIGIEYSKYLKKINAYDTSGNRSYNLEKHSVFRYGRYSLRYQNRKGDLCFVCEKNSQEFVMDPRDIALSEELIDEFNAAQAFYIGLLAGLKFNNPVNTVKSAQKSKKPHLWIVK